MTAVLILNAVLAGVVLTAVLAVALWPVRRAHHEGRPLVVASRRQWIRPTISLRPHRPSQRVRPFVLDLE